MPASGHQDHTPSPSASGALVLSAIRVHRILSRVRDDLEPPLQWDRTGRVIKVICVFGKSEYFCKRGWTGKSVICLSGTLTDLSDVIRSGQGSLASA